MLNALRPALERLLTPVVRALARAGVTPNQITVVGTLGVAGGALGLFPTGHLFAGTIVCTAFVFADTIDGLLARVTGSTGACGAFLPGGRCPGVLREGPRGRARPALRRRHRWARGEAAHQPGGGRARRARCSVCAGCWAVVACRGELGHPRPT